MKLGAGLLLTCLPWLAWAQPVHRMDLDGAMGILVEDHTLPRVELGVTMRSGAAMDPATKEGLARFAGQMLLRGSKAHARPVFEERIDTLGASIEVDTGHSYLTLSGEVLADGLPEFLHLFANALLTPTLLPDELERQRRELQDDLMALRDDDQALAGRFFRAGVFAGHPYGRPVGGTAETLATIKVGDVAAFFDQHLVKKNVIFWAAGDLSPEQFRKAWSEHFSGLKDGEAPRTTLPVPTPPKGRKVWVVQKPARTQSQILVGHPAPSVHHQDRMALEVLNTAFGGTFAARLMQEIRVERGWSYGAYSRLGGDRHGGSFFMWLFPQSSHAAPALGRVIQMFEEVAAQGLSEQELRATQGYLRNAFAFRVDTAGKRVAELVRLAVLGLPNDHLETYRKRIDAVSLDDVRRVARTHLDPKNILITVLCSEDLSPKPWAQVQNAVLPPRQFLFDASVPLSGSGD